MSEVPFLEALCYNRKLLSGQCYHNTTNHSGRSGHSTNSFFKSLGGVKYFTCMISLKVPKMFGRKHYYSHFPGGTLEAQRDVPWAQASEREDS